jgi:hypothetical protein
MNLEALNQAQNKVDECINTGDLLGAGRWLIAFERNISDFAKNCQGPSLKIILTEKKSWLDCVTLRIDNKKAKPKMKNLRSLLCYGQIKHSIF